MNEHDTRLLSAYLDKQLDDELTAQLEARLEQEPALRRQLDRLRETDAQLHSAFNSIVNVPLPQGIEDLLSDETQSTASEQSSVVQLRPKDMRAGIVSKPPRSSWIPLSLAASVTLAFGFFLGLNQSAMDISPSDASQALQLHPGITRILSHRASGEVNQVSEPAAFSVRTELSFIDKTGQFCRQYHLQAQQAYRGIACRENQRWNTAIIVPAVAQTADASDYQAASAFVNPVITQYLEQHMQGIALGKAEEQAQLDKLVNAD